MSNLEFVRECQIPNRNGSNPALACIICCSLSRSVVESSFLLSTVAGARYVSLKSGRTRPLTGERKRPAL